MTTDIANTIAAEQKPRIGGLQYNVWAGVGITTILIWVLFGDALVDMAHDWWNEPSLSQGMLLPPLALYIAWIQRQRWLSIPAGSDARGVIVSALACAVFVLGKLASEFFLMRISFVILLAGLVWTYWGKQRLKALGFPLVVLATMVPLPALVYNSLAAPLQLLASDLATQIAQAVGISVFRDGNIIQLAGVQLGVAEACSGLTSLSSLMVGGVLLGYLMCDRIITRVLLFATAIPLAIVVNIMRVTGTAIIADYNEEYAMGYYHSFSGWLVFVAGFGLLYLVAKALHALMDPKQNATTGVA